MLAVHAPLTICGSHDFSIEAAAEELLSQEQIIQEKASLVQMMQQKEASAAASPSSQQKKVGGRARGRAARAAVTPKGQTKLELQPKEKP